MSHLKPADFPKGEEQLLGVETMTHHHILSRNWWRSLRIVEKLFFILCVGGVLYVTVEVNRTLLVDSFDNYTVYIYRMHKSFGKRPVQNRSEGQIYVSLAALVKAR